MATREGSGPKANRTGSSKNPNASADNAIEIDGNDEYDRRTPFNQRISIPAGNPPKMPSGDKALNWQSNGGNAIQNLVEKSTNVESNFD